MPYKTAKPSPWIRGTAALGLLCSAALLFAGCEKKTALTPPPPPKVTVSRPVAQTVADYLEFTGNTQAVNTVQLVARVQGYLEKVFFRDGDVVKKGQPLFQIQQDTYVAKLRQAEGNVLAQKALFDHARTEYARYTNLFDQKAAAQTDVENWRYQRDSAQAALTAAEAQRDLAKLDLGYTSVAAPFNGRIDRRLVDPGNVVGPGGGGAEGANTNASPGAASNSGATTVVAQITQLDPLYVYFNLSESDMASLSAASGELSGQGKAPKFPAAISLAGEEGYPRQGYLDFASNSVNPATGTLLMRGVFPNHDGKILPGQYARVKVTIGKEKSALCIPGTAVAFDQIGAYVMAVNEQNVVERRDVATGPLRDGWYVIERGLFEDDWVIVKGLVRAAPGRKVTPEKVEGLQQRPIDGAQAKSNSGESK